MRMALVYQVGLANVFRTDGGDRVRLLQSAYSRCEEFCAGAIAAGADVEVFHADVAGDCSGADWFPGRGHLWCDRKHPPIGAAGRSYR